MIAYDTNHAGTEAHVYRMVKLASGNYRFDTLGHVKGGDPVNLFINVALQHTPHDAELFALIGELTAERLAALTGDIQKQINAVTGIADVLAGAMAPLKSRPYV